MFNLFKTRPVVDTEWKSIPMPPVKPAKVASENGYTVGVDLSGSTVLKLNYDGQISTLTMNTAGTRQLIKLLEATLIEEEDA